VRQGWFVYEPVRAEAVGNKRYLPLGRLTHHLLVQGKLEELGFSGLKEDDVKRITERVRRTAEKNARFVEDDELGEIARQELK
jgi:isopropylmalate/homocitrate/citramalate synthase